MIMPHERPEFYRFHNGDKVPLPFAADEYDTRLMRLRAAMDGAGVEVAVTGGGHREKAAVDDVRHPDYCTCAYSVERV